MAAGAEARRFLTVTKYTGISAEPVEDRVNRGRRYHITLIIQRDTIGDVFPLA